MSTAGRNSVTGIYTFFYWSGVVLTLGCLGLATLGNSSLLSPFEHTAIPLSWQLGGLAVMAFLAAEFGCPAPLEARESETESPHLSGEWEVVGS